ncbi:MAG: hypothetical protein KC589_04650 [Nanoarchaeota archaeon]|nr:hypothetical protein [Nanoarchaeota archaeon]
MANITNFPSSKDTKVGKLSILRLNHAQGLFGFANFNTVNCSGHQLRGLYFPFFFDKEYHYYSNPCIFGKIIDLSQVYSQELIAKGREYIPIYPSKYPHILIKPPFKLNNLIQEKILEILDN